MNQDFKDLMRLPSLRSTFRSLYWGLHDLAARALIRKTRQDRMSIIRLR